LAVRRYASAYERELKDLLQGEPSAVRSYAKGLEPTDRSEFERIIDAPFLVIRAAGSLGLDLIALRRDFAFPLEVKSSAEETIRFTAAGGRGLLQLEAHRKAVAQVGLTVLYAYRRVGYREPDPWRMYIGTKAPTRGILNLVCRRLPTFDTTRDGNEIIRWDQGMPLSRFLATVRFLTETPTLETAA